jgi:DNA-binding NarL/FixJ family response regulator
LVHKREIFREGLSRLLASQPGMEVVGACGSGTEAIEKVSQQHCPPMITTRAFFLFLDRQKCLHICF